MTTISHLDHETILRKCRFDLAGIKTNERRRLDNDRMSRQMYAIMCHTSITSKKRNLNLNHDYFIIFFYRRARLVGNLSAISNGNHSICMHIY